MNTNKNWQWLGIIFLIIAVILIIISFLPKDNGNHNGNLDSFAQCLTQKGMVMYGTYWCSHCQNQKAAFGDSFKYINYIECSDQPQKCADDGVNATPTWKVSSTTMLVGEQSLEELASTTGCVLGD